MNAIITGASKGIGYHTAIQLAEKGYNLLLLSRDETALKELTGHCRQISAASVSYKRLNLLELSAEIGEINQFITDHFDACVDVLINNAGKLINKTFTDFTEEDVMALMKINFMAPARLIAHFIPFLRESDNGHVVNISSMGGFQGSVKFPGLSYYSASKGALAVLTEVLAEEYKDTGIAFNCLALGAVQTTMLNEAFPGLKAPLSAQAMAEFIADFAINGYRYFNGKVLPVSSTTP